MPLLEQFWSLSRSDYKSEVFKIINDSALYLEQEHIEYLFDQITETSASKLGMEEFDALQNMGRFSRSTQFQAKTGLFFWQIITISDDHKAELIQNCINKFCEMIKYSSIDAKKQYFDKLVAQLQSGNSAVPVFLLFKKIIKDITTVNRAPAASSAWSSAGGTTGWSSTTTANGQSW